MMLARYVGRVDAVPRGGSAHRAVCRRGDRRCARVLRRQGASWHRLLLAGPDLVEGESELPWRPEGRRALGVRARARIVENYQLDQVVARFEALYSDMAKVSR